MPLPSANTPSMSQAGPPLDSNDYINPARALDDTTFVVSQQINQNNIAEGAQIPPIQHGEFRLQPPEGFRVARKTNSFGGTIFVLSWFDVVDSSDGLGQSHLAGYRIYATLALGNNTQATLVGQSTASPCVCRVTGDVASSVVFSIQPYLTSGLSLPLERCPTTTGTVPAPSNNLNPTFISSYSNFFVVGGNSYSIGYTPTQGNLLVVGISTGPILTSFTDNIGNVWTIAVSKTLADGSHARIYYTTASTADPLTIMFGAATALSGVSIDLLEFASVGAFDAVTGATGTSTAPASGNVTTAATGDLLVGFIASADDGLTGENYTVAASTASSGGPPSHITSMGYRLAGAAGNYASSGTTSASAAWAAITAAWLT